MREDEQDPGDADSAHADDGHDRRNERDSESPQVSAHHFIKHAERIGRKDHDESGVADFDDFRISCEDCKQVSAEEKHEEDGGCRCDCILYQTQCKHLFAPLQLSRPCILPDKSRAGLAERVEHVIGEDLDVVCRTRCGDDDRTQAVDGSLDDDVRQCEYCALDPGGNADFQDASQNLRVDADFDRIDSHRLTRCPEDAKQDKTADEVGKYSGGCQAGHSQVQDGCCKKVEDDVQNA